MQCSFDQYVYDWDVSHVKDMSYLFYAAESFNRPLNSWNVSKVTNMEYMFRQAKKFNQYLNGWDVLKVENMQRLFSIAESFNSPLFSWDVTSVRNMYDTFARALEFDQDLSAWNVSNVENMHGTFYSAVKFNHPLHTWDVLKVTDMTYIFYAALSFRQDLCVWGDKLQKDNNVIVTNMFGSTSCLTTENPDLAADRKGSFCFQCNATAPSITQTSTFNSTDCLDNPELCEHCTLQYREDTCEGWGYNEEECLALKCCQYNGGCSAAVDFSQDGEPCCADI